MSNENNVENMDSQQPEKSEGKTEKSLASGDGKIVSEVNTGVAIKNIESESLNSLLVYDSDSSASSEMEKLNLNWKTRREDSEDSETSSSSSSSSSDDDDDDSDTSSEEEELPSRGAIRKRITVPKSEGEMSLDELPPVPDLSKLNITVDDEKFEHMGNVFGIVDKLVTVAALPNTPPYDLDTLLFLDNGKRPLGFVFDVLGQVTSPIYAIRFNSVEDIKNLQIEIGTKVYSAPKSKHTQYVFLQHLLKMKGTDASWNGDNECPSEFADYSDDESECYQRYGNKKLSPHAKRTHSSDNYKKFESTMNKRNILNTKFNKYMDSYKQARMTKMKKVSSKNGGVPVYDPSIPPPTFAHHLASYCYQGMLPPEYCNPENNNTNYYMNNFVANLANNTNHPGPSHE